MELQRTILALYIRLNQNCSAATSAVITKQSSVEFTMCLKATKFDFGPCTERVAHGRECTGHFSVSSAPHSHFCVRKAGSTTGRT